MKEATCVWLSRDSMQQVWERKTKETQTDITAICEE